MSLPEMVWRVEDRVRQTVDRLASGSRQADVPVERLINGHGRQGLITSRLFGEVWSPDAVRDPKLPANWRVRAAGAADSIAANRLSFFDLVDQELGDPIQWNYEHKAKKTAPLIFAPDIDYRDYSITGDCKFVWEPSRHHQWVTLGRAYRLTGDERYAQAALDQMVGWMDQCPFGMGMNWRSPLELGIRLINWVWMLELIRPSDACASRSKVIDRVLSSAYRHLWDISRKFSRFSSANNHLIGEAAGVFIGSCYFPGFAESAALRRQSHEILEREIVAQTFDDGGNREQAFGYHTFVTQFFLLAGLAGRECGADFSSGYWRRLETMIEFVATLVEGGEPPMYGDCDDGYVLDLGGRLGEPHNLLAVGAVLFNRSDFRSLVSTLPEPVYWLFGTDGCDRFKAMPRRESGHTLRSVALADSGHYLLQWGRIDDPSRISVVIDCGPLGYESIAAHGHADALSLTLRVGGVDVLVDPGTYDYFTYGRWRDYFRSTPAHNTVEVDGMNQSEPLGPFMWGRQASANCIRFEPDSEGGVFEGEHDGYRRLTDPVVHRRRVTLSGEARTIAIEDELTARGEHTFALHLHLAEHCRVDCLSANRYRIDYGQGQAEIEFDSALSVSAVTGSQDPSLGWVSRGYHQRRPATTLSAVGCRNGGVAFRTQLTVMPGQPKISTEG